MLQPELRPAYGLQLRNSFEARTGQIWPLNVGQVYTTLNRLERDGLVRQRPESGDKLYEITPAGSQRLRDWFAEPVQRGTPSRDELVLKLVLAVGREGVRTFDVIQTERKATVRQLQDFTRLKREADPEADIGWLFLLDSLIFQAEARVRWLDACEARLRRRRPAPKRKGEHSPQTVEVRR